MSHLEGLSVRSFLWWFFTLTALPFFKILRFTSKQNHYLFIFYFNFFITVSADIKIRRFWVLMYFTFFFHAYKYPIDWYLSNFDNQGYRQIYPPPPLRRNFSKDKMGNILSVFQIPYGGKKRIFKENRKNIFHLAKNKGIFWRGINLKNLKPF